ncbi:hypothetical protein FB45DRAFT_932692 [Roridomyces roridus]|uniref:AMP-dependent synthetase/ligase domain-containing protein n=1 Tax=Roridomyces roridus TaxID=1738132 RepID=A0AAD7FFS6_9AGAR|nr:hypothetical protein FB45DRAFT_932692 [Roridomyces roridus]
MHEAVRAARALLLPPMALDTLPGLVSRNLARCPLDPCYVYAESNDVVTITHLEFGRATHRAAHLLRPNREGKDGKVVAIIAESDTMVYNAIFVGLMTANLIPFPISPRNSPPAILQLLQASSCHHIVATRVTLAPLLSRLEQHIAEADPEFTLSVDEVPSLAQLYPNLGVETPECAFQPYPEGNAHPEPDDLLMYIHSSGSTGFPKAIPWNYRMLNHVIAISTIDMRAQIQPPAAIMGLPPFHIYGIGSQLVRPLCGIHAAVFPPRAITPDALPMSASPDNVLDHARRTNSRTISTVPTFLVTWFNDPQAFEYLKQKMDSIIWGGGPLPQRIGDAYVNAGIRLINAYGTTETSGIASLSAREEDRKDWAWFRIGDRVKVRWAPQGDGTFECQVLATETYVPLVLNLPDVKGYATSDLCVNHPTKKDLWRIVGRLDDTIVHTSGEKTVPVPLENIIISSPLVKGVVVFGHERQQTGVLIELIPEEQMDVKDEAQLAELRNKIWPVIEEANAIAPGFSRIFKEMILFTSHEKPLPRAGKGTVMRKAAIKLYTPEIDALYTTAEEHAVDSIKAPTIWTTEYIQPWLMEVAAVVCNFTSISPTMDLRQQGFDSLAATVFRLHITKGLRSRKLDNAAAAIPQQLVYARPTISELSSFLEALVGGGLSQTEIDQTAPAPAEPSAPSSFTASDETVVELRSDGGVPFIVFPGVRGTLDAIIALRANFSGTIWGIQILESAPIEPFSALASFLLAKIQAKRPKGPYRLVSYSGSSVVVVAITKMLEEAGEEVLQVSFIDHFPLLWTSPGIAAALKDEGTRRAHVDALGQHIIQNVNLDPLYGPDSDLAKMFAEVLNMEDAAGGVGGSEAMAIQRRYMSVRHRTMSSLLDFLATFLPPANQDQDSGPTYAESFTHWVSKVNAPMSAITAEFGLAAKMEEDVRREWGDLGASRCLKPVTHCYLTGVGHLGVLGDRRMAAFLQQQ